MMQTRGFGRENVSVNYDPHGHHPSFRFKMPAWSRVGFFEFCFQHLYDAFRQTFASRLWTDSSMTFPAASGILSLNWMRRNEGMNTWKSWAATECGTVSISHRKAITIAASLITGGSWTEREYILHAGRQPRFLTFWRHDSEQTDDSAQMALTSFRRYTHWKTQHLKNDDFAIISQNRQRSGWQMGRFEYN